MVARNLRQTCVCGDALDVTISVFSDNVAKAKKSEEVQRSGGASLGSELRKNGEKAVVSLSAVTRLFFTDALSFSLYRAIHESICLYNTFIGYLYL